MVINMYYPIVIHQEVDSCYGVIVPDIDGCFSAGDSLEEAIEQAKEAIDFHLEGIAEDGEEIPSPKDISFHQSNSEYDGGTWALVQINLSDYLGKAQRLNISLPIRLISKIDRMVKESSEYKDRSKFLAEAALKVLS
jgi:predicted RNase H-like HicB family nuclease